jgi:divalent metal cation (Fe/Co/Zn/Cd) transporter
MVWVQVVVDPELSVREGHDIGHAVENRICAEGDVVQVHAHVDVDEEED